MKQLFIAGVLSVLGLGLPALNTSAQPKAPTQTSAKPLNVAFLVYPGVECLDLSGPLDVLVKANEISPGSFNIYTVGTQPGAITTQNGVLTLTPRYTLARSPHPDILIVPGASQPDIDRLGQNVQFLRWVQHNATSSQQVMSVCTGAFLLGKAGLLDGKNTTTHWLTLDDFQRRFPKTKAFQGVRFLKDGNIITTAGVSSGIDGAFFLVEELKGKAMADMVAKAIQYQRGLPSYPAEPRGRVKLAKTVISAPIGNRELASPTDPVCGMPVGKTTHYTFSYSGKLYGFCSPMCRDKFAANPQSFIKTTSKK